MKGKSEETITNLLKNKIRNLKNVTKLAGDASSREYYRIFTREGTMVAMVYPNDNSEEIERIVDYSRLYSNKGLRVPEIIDRIGDNILIQEDIGDISLQAYLAGASDDDLMKIEKGVKSILERLKSIPPGNTDFLMDKVKIEFEINFFIENFVKKLIPGFVEHNELFEEIINTLEKLNNNMIFAHRDFHSRNIFYKEGELILIDFQDSLLAPEFYDAVSFVFDSYMKVEHSEYFFSLFKDKNNTEMEQIYLTAYQRNIKALGTFGFQNYSGNEKFFSYIEPTINNLRRNAFFSDRSLLGLIFEQFEGSFQV